MDMDATICLEQVQTAHRNAQMHFSSRSRYRRMLKTYMLNNNEKLTIFKRKRPISSKRNGPDPATEKQLAHLDYAKAAVSYLRSRQLHFAYVSKNRCHSTATASSVFVDSSASNHNTPNAQAIRLPTPHVVPTRSNLLIDGLPSMTNDRQRSTQVSNASEMYAVLSALYGGLHLSGWTFKFASEIELWCWRSSGLVMVAAPLGMVLMLWSLYADDWNNKTLRNRPSALVREPGTDKNRNRDRRKDEMSTAPHLPSSTHARTTPPSWSTTLFTHFHNFFRSVCRHILSVAISCVMYPSMIAAAIGWTLYPFARLYVLVEAFAALRASDPDVYKIVQWADWIPHVG
jgi:hypothetical protein